MVQFRADTTFPYLALARQMDLEYRKVLEVSDLIWRRYLHPGGEPILVNLATFVGLSLPATEAIFYTTKNERDRRRIP